MSDNEDLFTDGPSLKYCNGCGKYFDETDVKKCKVCGNYFCLDCAKKHDCRTNQAISPSINTNSVPEKSEIIIPASHTPNTPSRNTKRPNGENKIITSQKSAKLSEKLICDGCGEVFYKNELKKCPKCGAVLCNACQKSHTCNSRVSKYTNNKNLKSTACGKQISERSYSSLEEMMSSAKANDPNAQTLIGLRYVSGNGPIKKDIRKAKYWLEKGAINGNILAQSSLADLYYSSNNPDYISAAYWYSKAAEQGDSDAQVTLYLIYLDGKGGLKNEKLAMYWCSKAAELNNPDALSFLGFYYLNSFDKKEVNIPFALSCFEKAAKLGDATAQFTLALEYKMGDNIEINPYRAFSLFKSAANQAYPEAERELSFCYATGFGVPKSETEAEKWCERAYEHGIAKSETYLSIAIAFASETVVSGIYTQPDDQKSAYWFMKSAENGNADAQYIIGKYYDAGSNGLIQDPVKAMYWYQKAAAQGHKSACEKVNFEND